MIIGLTGSMGSGKSSVAAFLQKKNGMVVVDADQICRDLLGRGNLGWQALQERFGSRFLNHDMTLNRIRLRREIFADHQLRLQINALIHPLVRRAINKITGRFDATTPASPPARGRADGGASASRMVGYLVEVPLLFEAQWQGDFDRVVVVYADSRSCLARLQLRDGIRRSEAEQCLAAQCPASIKSMLADHVVDNSGPWLATCLQVLHLSRLFVLEGGKET